MRRGAASPKAVRIASRTHDSSTRVGARGGFPLNCVQKIVGRGKNSFRNTNKRLITVWPQ
jgi:hypothetical protein